MNKLALVTNETDAAERIGGLYANATKGSIENLNAYAIVGESLLIEKSNHAHGEWEQWLDDNAEALGFGVWKAQRMMWLAKEIKKLASQSFTDEKLQELYIGLWGHSGAPTRGTAGTGENEWYTPQEYIELARKVLGTIDLDPASGEQAQSVVKAKKFHTKDDDGLAQTWRGSVWLNPPYAQPLIDHFTKKMCDEWDAGNIKAGIMLTHNYTDTKWFQYAARKTELICFTAGRIAFVDAEGDKASPTQGQAFFYFGGKRSLFAKTFSKVGFVVAPKEGGL
jgi:phage N-6-adenine-methyltransferase